MKPFNLEHAKAGAPVALEDGTEATIIKFDGRNEACPLVVLVGPNDRPHLASIKGYVSFGPMNNRKQLVMRPVGTLQGREVYHGDELLHITPGNGNIVNVTINASQPYMDFTDGVFTERYWSWPAAYPVTRMSHKEGCAAYDDVEHLESRVLSVANAAIRHGIDNGYLLDAASEHGRILAEIANGLGWTKDYAHADIPAAVRMREVAIAKHFYNKGCINITTGLIHPLYRALEASEITAELTKVKP